MHRSDRHPDLSVRISQLLLPVILTLSPALPTAAETLEFSGYNWVVRGPGQGGPGPNYWDPKNVFVDTNGFLHLRLSEREGTWYAAEVQTREPLGFGRYEFRLTGLVDRLDRNVVLGLFSYPTADVGPDGTHEIDIEIAQWGNPTGPNGSFTVWPTTNSMGHVTRHFTFKLEGDSSKHTFTWTPTNLLFRSEEESAGSGSRLLADWEYRPGNPASISTKPMPVHLNLWCFRGVPPSDGKAVEVIVRGFRFTPLPAEGSKSVPGKKD